MNSVKSRIGYVLAGVVFYVAVGVSIGYLFHLIMKMRGF